MVLIFNRRPRQFLRPNPFKRPLIFVAVAFLDILGFSPLIESDDLAVVKNRLKIALDSVALTKSAAALDVLKGMKLKPFHSFSFSDTFVLLSEDDSPESLVSFLIGSTLLTRQLFAQTLPVRGIITFGEADFVADTEHAIGKAIVVASILEKKQEWLGVVVGEGRMPAAALAIFQAPFFTPLFKRWDVPSKDGQVLTNALVINWRYNLTVEGGTKSLFRPSVDPRANQKIQNTLAFALYLRRQNMHEGTGAIVDPAGNSSLSPWLMNITTMAPGSTNVVHGDEY